MKITIRALKSIIKEASRAPARFSVGAAVVARQDLYADNSDVTIDDETLAMSGYDATCSQIVAKGDIGTIVATVGKNNRHFSANSWRVKVRWENGHTLTVYRRDIDEKN